MDNVKSSSRVNNKKKCASWKKRTLLERYLILICLALFVGLISLIGLHIFYRHAHRVPARSICNSPACKREAGRILKNMDTSINPCDNFYTFACGSFLKYERVSDETLVSFTEGEEYLLRYCRASIEEADEKVGPEFVKLKKFYNSCLKKPSNTSQIITELLNKTNLGRFPVFNDAVDKSLEEVLASTIIFNRDARNPLFYISNYQNIMRLSKGSSLINWIKFLDSTDDEVRMKKEKYLDLLILTLFHSTKPSYNMEDDANDILGFHALLNDVSSRERGETEVVIKVSELDNICPEIKWKKFLKPIYEVFGNSDEAPSLGERNITVEDEYLKDICQLINLWDRRVVQNLLIWNFLAQALLHFDPSFHKSFGEIDPESFEFYSRKHYQIKWKECVNAVHEDVIFQSGLIYSVIERMKPDKNLKEIKEYLNNIKEAMDHMFMKEDWLDDHSRKVLRNQLNEIKATIGYYEESRDINLVEKLFRNVIVSDDYIDNWLQNRKVFHLLDSTEESMSLSVNRLSSPLLIGAFGGGGSLFLPLESLVPPMFMPDVPKYLNYGSIGFLIAHEISHSFDYAEANDLSPEALTIFKKKSDCYVKQYSALPLDENGIMVDGENTIRDNIADNSGIIQAFSAYLEYVEGEDQKESLPGLNYTNRQMFFIKYAQLWCEILESPSKSYKHNMHSPGKYRVLEPLKNFPSFANEFNCPRGSFMNPQKKCRLWG